MSMNVRAVCRFFYYDYANVTFFGVTADVTGLRFV